MSMRLRVFYSTSATFVVDIVVAHLSLAHMSLPSAVLPPTLLAFLALGYSRTGFRCPTCDEVATMTSEGRPTLLVGDTCRYCRKEY